MGKSMYTKPSIALNWFDVVDIMSASTEGDNGGFSLEWLALDVEESEI